MFVLSKVLWWFAQPTRLWLILTILSSLLLYTALFRQARIALLSLTIVAFIALVLPIDLYAMRPLEQRFPQPKLPEHITGIIVLGGAVDQILTELYGQANLNSAAERMTEAVQLAFNYPNAKLVFSGGSAEIKPRSSFREADVAEQFYQEIGLDSARLIFERESRNTFENAVFTKELLNPQKDEVWVLVTSAFHMPRAVGIFEELEWGVIPYPVDYRVGLNIETSPPVLFSGKLFYFDIAAKEWLGLLAYKLMGRTSAFFPKP